MFQYRRKEYNKHKINKKEYIMRKIKIIVVLTLIVSLLALTGCGTVTDTGNSYSPTTDTTEKSNEVRLRNIDGETELVYDTETKIVYYCFDHYFRGNQYRMSYMSPYLSKNGNFCRFDEKRQRIIEITK